MQFKILYRGKIDFVLRNLFRMLFIGGVLFLYAGCESQSQQKARLLARWKLESDVRDYSGNNLHGTNHGVTFHSSAYSSFNGVNSYIEVPNHELLQLGDRDFTVSAWIKCDSGARMIGDIVSKYDQESRTGINFNVFSSSSGYSGVSDYRSVLFGIDNGKEGEWIDCGRPSESNTIVSSLITFGGNLYAGIGDATDPSEACRIFRYDGDGKWIDMGRISTDLKTPSVMATLIHRGKLYVATGKWDYAQQPSGGKAGLYEYMGNKTWKECGSVKGKRVMSIASLGDHIYVVDNLAATYRFNDATGEWSQIIEASPAQYINEVGSSLKFRSMNAFQDKLYGGAGDTIKQFENNNWKTVGAFNPENINQVHTLDVYQGKLYAGTWPDGSIVRYDGDGRWKDCGWIGASETATVNGRSVHNNEINDLIVYNGKMYAGAIPKGEVWRYEGGEKSTLIKRLVVNPDYSVSEHESWSRVTSMAVYRGQLFAGTSTARGVAKSDQTFDVGKVFRWEAGKAVTYDDDLGTDWHMITATREKNALKLFVDGKLVSTSTPIVDSSISVSNNEPLMIGFGSLNYFKGAMKDVRLYAGALDETEIKQLYKPGTE